MQRVDLFPTHEYQGLKLRPGRPYPFGATVIGNAVNFSVYSRYATSCTLVLFHNREEQPFVEIPFFREFRLGNVFSMMVFALDYENIEYGYRMDGPYCPEEGHRFDKTKILLDPYAKLIVGRDVWGDQPNWDSLYQYRARLVFDDFDWENDLPLETPVNDLIVYEMHVRNFTCGDAAGVKHKGTFARIVEKIPYLKQLGVNCVELMPVHEFDEFENYRPSPVDGHPLYNLWGYSNVGFFAPKAAYASSGRFSMQADELKNMVKQLHTNGIEVILDVVFNHTAEGDQRGPYISYRGIDNKTYYMLTPDGSYFNFSGCGNTLNCNNPNVRDMIVESLRYWVTDYHIDGFRFGDSSKATKGCWPTSRSASPALPTSMHPRDVASRPALISSRRMTDSRSWTSSPITKSTTRQTVRTTATVKTITTAGTAVARALLTMLTSTACATGKSRTPSPYLWSARAYPWCSVATRWATHSRVTTMPTARTTSWHGSTGTTSNAMLTSSATSDLSYVSAGYTRCCATRTTSGIPTTATSAILTSLGTVSGPGSPTAAATTSPRPSCSTDGMPTTTAQREEYESVEGEIVESSNVIDITESAVGSGTE